MCVGNESLYIFSFASTFALFTWKTSWEIVWQIQTSFQAGAIAVQGTHSKWMCLSHFCRRNFPWQPVFFLSLRRIQFPRHFVWLTNQCREYFYAAMAINKTQPASIPTPLVELSLPNPRLACLCLCWSPWAQLLAPINQNRRRVQSESVKGERSQEMSLT